MSLLKDKLKHTKPFEFIEVKINLNLPASILATRKEQQEAVQSESFYSQKGEGTRKLYWAKK